MNRTEQSLSLVVKQPTLVLPRCAGQHSLVGCYYTLLISCMLFNSFISFTLSFYDPNAFSQIHQAPGPDFRKVGKSLIEFDNSKNLVAKPFSRYSQQLWSALTSAYVFYLLILQTKWTQIRLLPVWSYMVHSVCFQQFSGVHLDIFSRCNMQTIFSWQKYWQDVEWLRLKANLWVIIFFLLYTQRLKLSTGLLYFCWNNFQITMKKF